MSLSGVYTFVGKGDWALDATGGSATGGGTITAAIPVGSHVEKAYLYASEFFGGYDPTATLSLGANSVAVSGFTALGHANSYLEAYRLDVTSTIQSMVGSGSATPYDFTISDVAGSNTDGYMLAIVYSNAASDQHTIALLDGASATTGDSFTLNFAEPVDTSVAGFQALMSVGIGFGYQASFNGQSSTIEVNGRLLTSMAGGEDDGTATNGGLITVGGTGDDPANPADPAAIAANGSNATRTDDELYNLALGNASDPTPYLTNGTTSVQVTTLNPSNDDNIFFTGFNISAKAAVDSAQNDAPVAVDDGGTGFRTTESHIFTTANLLANDFDPDGNPLTIVGIDTTGTLGLATLNPDGTVTYNPNGKFNALDSGQHGTDSFTYTISDGTLTSTATVFITVDGEANTRPPSSGGEGFMRLSDASETKNYSGASGPVYIQALGGDDRVLGSRYSDSLNGGEGNDNLSGGAGNDKLTGGPGQDRMSGGTGNDTFIFFAGDLNAARGQADHIIDFQGAGTNSNPAGDHDFIALFGFGAGSTLSFWGNGGTPNLQYYQVIDGTDPSHSGFLLVQMADGTSHLDPTDYKFF